MGSTSTEGAVACVNKSLAERLTFPINFPAWINFMDAFLRFVLLGDAIWLFFGSERSAVVKPSWSWWSFLSGVNETLLSAFFFFLVFSMDNLRSSKAAANVVASILARNFSLSTTLRRRLSWANNCPWCLFSYMRFSMAFWCAWWIRWALKQQEHINCEQTPWDRWNDMNASFNKACSILMVLWRTSIKPKQDKYAAPKATNVKK